MLNLLYPYILIYPDISRFVLTDRLASLNVCDDSLLFCFGRQGPGPICFVTCLGLKLIFLCMYQKQLCKVMSCLRSFFIFNKQMIDLFPGHRTYFYVCYSSCHLLSLVFSHYSYCVGQHDF